jgi:hypothetical protein
VKVIAGAVPIGNDFQGVADITRSGDAEISITGKGGERIGVSCDLDFLARSS